MIKDLYPEFVENSQNARKNNNPTFKIRKRFVNKYFTEEDIWTASNLIKYLQ